MTWFCTKAKVRYITIYFLRWYTNTRQAVYVYNITSTNKCWKQTSTIDKNFVSIQNHQTLIKQTMRVWDRMNVCPRICLRNIHHIWILELENSDVWFFHAQFFYDAVSAHRISRIWWQNWFAKKAFIYLSQIYNFRFPDLVLML